MFLSRLSPFVAQFVRWISRCTEMWLRSSCADHTVTNWVTWHVTTGASLSRCNTIAILWSSVLNSQHCEPSVRLKIDEALPDVYLPSPEPNLQSIQNFAVCNTWCQTWCRAWQDRSRDSSSLFGYIPALASSASVWYSSLISPLSVIWFRVIIQDLISNN